MQTFEYKHVLSASMGSQQILLAVTAATVLAAGSVSAGYVMVHDSATACGGMGDMHRTMEHSTHERGDPDHMGNETERMDDACRSMMGEHHERRNASVHPRAAGSS